MMRIKAVVLLTTAGLSILFAFMVLLMNMDRDWPVRFLTEEMLFSRAVWMLLNAGAGVGLYFIFKHVLPVGLRALHAAKAAQQMRQVQRLAEQPRNHDTNKA